MPVSTPKVLPFKKAVPINKANPIIVNISPPFKTSAAANNIIAAATMRAQYEEGDQTTATKSDVHNVAREMFYAMHEMKKHIIAYLKENA